MEDELFLFWPDSEDRGRLPLLLFSDAAQTLNLFNPA
jgi:hypothetical protein